MRKYGVRAAEHKDVETISSIAMESWRHTYGSIYPIEVIDRFVSSAYSHENLHASIAKDSGNPMRLFHVAIDQDKRIVGYSQSIQDPVMKCVFELARIYALPGSIGSGVGTTLLDYLFSRSTSICELSAWVEERNGFGRKFYEKHGFRISDEREEDLFGYKTREVKYTLTVHS